MSQVVLDIYGGLMELLSNLKNITEIGIGLLFLVGAIFNLSYTLGHGEEFFGSFAASAFFRPSRKLVRSVVIPQAKLFTILLVALQVSVAATILSRGNLIQYGLMAGAVFCLAALLVSNVPGAIANLTLTALQIFLAFTR